MLQELGPLALPVAMPDGAALSHPGELLLNDLERRVLSAIDNRGASIDQIVSESGLTTPQVLATLSVLEMRRIVRRLSGNVVARIS